MGYHAILQDRDLAAPNIGFLSSTPNLVYLIGNKFYMRKDLVGHCHWHSTFPGHDGSKVLCRRDTDGAIVWTDTVNFSWASD